jgi:hypothetical protein
MPGREGDPHSPALANCAFGRGDAKRALEARLALRLEIPVLSGLELDRGDTYEEVRRGT